MDLAQELSDIKVHLTGTILRNRIGLPLQIRKRKSKSNGTRSVLKLKKGDMNFYRKDDCFSLVHWKDKNEVTMLSTLYGNGTQIVHRTKKQGIVEEVKKPTAVCQYNKYMGGVDLADHFIASYGFTRKSLKWWRKVFFWLQEAALVNAYILYNMSEAQGKVSTSV
uniref:PiggyBac transposable element-derived protein domain-containing protein n=1 Tax=Homalodisca liturata TaxID=320908 RepID=A0A1B6K7C1_9HEMI